MNQFYPALLLTLLGAATSAAHLAYIPNEKSGTVSVVDTATDTVLREIAAGKRPRGIAADAAGRTLYLTDAGASALLVLDAGGGPAHSPIALGPSAEGVHASADGRWIAVEAWANCPGVC